MCYLCLRDNPFAITDHSTLNIQSKKERAAAIKQLIQEYESINYCNNSAKEVEKLKEEQFLLSREI